MCFQSVDSIDLLFSWALFAAVFIRPPDIVVGGLIFYQAFFLSFFRQLISELAERSLTIFGHMVGSKCNLKTHVRNLGYPIPPTNRGPKNHLFWTTSQLNGNYNSLHLRNNTWYRQPGKCVNNYIVSKRHALWSRNGFKLEVSFHPPSVNSAFHLIARLRRRRSVNGTLPNFAKRWTVGLANNLP